MSKIEWELKYINILELSSKLTTSTESVFSGLSFGAVSTFGTGTGSSIVGSSSCSNNHCTADIDE